MVGESVFSSAHNSNLTPEFATFFCPSYFTAQEANMAPKISTTRQVTWTHELTSSSSIITRPRGARTVMPQSFCPFNMEEERTLLVKGEETTTPEVVKASSYCVP
jgi:hypothetical protein